MRHVLPRPWVWLAASAFVLAAGVYGSAAAESGVAVAAKSDEAAPPAPSPEAASPAPPPDALPEPEPADAAADTAPAQPPASPEARPSGEGPEPPEGRKVLRLEDLKDLPLLKRYELPLEKGEQLLTDVEDKTFGYDESAFWWLVHLVNKMPAEAFEPGQVTTGFSQLLAMPSAYRGKPVTIRGAYMTCAPFETPVLAIRKDVSTLYECNIRELPLEEERPVATVILIENPMDYENLRVWDTVTVRGYFYKVRRYEKQKGGESLSPMLVAKRLVPEEEVTAGRGLSSTVDLGSTNVWLAFMVGAILLLGIAYVFLRFRTKATPHAARYSAGHRFNLRRPGRDEPAGDPRPGSEGGQPEP